MSLHGGDTDLGRILCSFSPQEDPEARERRSGERYEVQDRSPDRIKTKNVVKSFPRVCVTPRDTSTSGGYRGSIFPRRRPRTRLSVPELKECEDRSPDRIKKKDGGRVRGGVTPRDIATVGRYRAHFHHNRSTSNLLKSRSAAKDRRPMNRSGQEKTQVVAYR